MHIIESSLKLAGVTLPIKSVVYSENDRTVLISPVPDLEKFKEEIDAVGDITDIVAPSGFHHMGVKKAKSLYPNAKLWASPALKEKRPDIAWDLYLGEHDWPLKDLTPYLVGGMPKVQEFVFFHAPSKTLVVWDLVFNILEGSGFMHFLFFKGFGTYKRFAMSRFFKSFIKDKEEFQRSMHPLFKLDIESLVMAHGTPVNEKAKEQMSAALLERGFR